jgi:hypothetical protein
LAADLSQTDTAIKGMHETLGLFGGIMENPAAPAVLRRQVATSMAYLTGDHGHRLEESGNKEDALAAFLAAAKRWEEIIAAYGDDAAATDALQWSKARAGKLRAP